MNNKGITLVEILAALVLLGILSAIVIPNINEIQKKKKAELETYKENSMIEAAKMYVADEIDKGTIFNNCESNSSCTKNVTVDNLLTSNYLSGDYKESDSSKTISITRITKPNGNYTFEYSISTSS